MTDLDLRPLSLGEILDRTFSLYRRNFLLFLGISALPNLMVLAVQLVPLLATAAPSSSVRRSVEQFQSRGATGLAALGIGGVIVGLFVYMVAYLFSQGGTVYAVSELYLGRATTIGASLSRMRGQLLSLFGVLLLNGLAIMGALIFLIIPGIYVACRLITCVPAALLEDLGPRSSLERSFQLTKDNAGRAFLIYFLYFILLYAALFLFALPFSVAGAMVAAKDPAMMRELLALSQVGNFCAGVLVTPFLTIATAVFYYDLRVRKEAFDLQIMMNPSGAAVAGTASFPKTFS